MTSEDRLFLSALRRFERRATLRFIARVIFHRLFRCLNRARSSL